MNQVLLGDCLELVPKLPQGSIDLIYIDPPFGTQSLWSSKAWGKSVQTELNFYDIFGGGVNGYKSFMRPRLREMHRLLKPTGSLFVHLDWRMAHYIKIELDKIFGVKNPALKNTNFVNEIIWCYSNSGRANKGFCKKHDTILWYSKTKKFFWNDYKLPVSKKYLESHYKQTDKQGKRCRVRVDAGKKRTYYPESGTSCNDWWSDIPSLNSMAKERRGWPTQKPLKLLDRIIKATTKEGDLVADFFCGSGVTAEAAFKLGRRFIVGDINPDAVKITKDRLKAVGCEV